MTTYIGLDIGGTKIAAAGFTARGAQLCAFTEQTPDSFPAFLEVCAQLVEKVQACDGVEKSSPIGVSCCGAVDEPTGTILSGNVPCIIGRSVRDDLSQRLNTPIRLGNDMNCMVLAEARDGAGQGYAVVHGITLSTGVGSGFVINGHIVAGLHGLAGEMGHLPLPFRDEGDAPPHPCICRQDDCIEKAICGAGLSRLYYARTGKEALPPAISDLAEHGDEAAMQVMDRYYHMVAKAMTTSLHFFDPDVIVLTGGLSRLPNLCEEVMARWGQYCLVKAIKTKLVLAKHGPMASLRGAAYLWL